MTGVDLGFSGEVAELYHRYRHGYPDAVIDVLADVFGLSSRDVVVDLGCGTGQLALAVAGRVRAVLGVDPEPDMLRRARQAAGEAGIGNVGWMLGADTDVPGLRRLLGDSSVAVVSIAQALHWMRHEELFGAALPLVRSGGGIAVMTSTRVGSWLVTVKPCPRSRGTNTKQPAEPPYRAPYVPLLAISVCGIAGGVVV